MVRIATRENAYTMAELAELDITPENVTALLDDTHRGWLCEDADQIVGFAMGNKTNGEMWVIAILPSHEKRGVGRQLITMLEDWLWSEGWDDIWLTTSEDTALRAYGFYLACGWKDREIRDGLRYMHKQKPDEYSRAAGE